MAKHPILEDYLRDLSARTGIDHVFGDDESARRRGAGKVVIWTPPPPGTAWHDANPPTTHPREADVFLQVTETLHMNVWGTDLYNAYALLFRIWRDGFDRDVEVRDGQPWRKAIRYGSTQRDTDLVPSNGFAITDRVVVRYLLPRQGEFYGTGETVPMAGEMKDAFGNLIGEI